MLSIEDINRELGRNIFIYPLDFCSIKSNSVDLTASRFAWTPDDGRYAFDLDANVIHAPSKRTICILTNEVLYVTEKIGGSCHSRMNLVMKGMGHIGTMIDPGYIGQLLIIMHNTTEHSIDIQLNERIVSVAFHYLRTPVKELAHQTSPGHREKLSGFENIDQYTLWCDQHQYTTVKRMLVDTFIRSPKYKEMKEYHGADYARWGGFRYKLCSFFRNYVIKYSVVLTICAIITLVSFSITGLGAPEITQIICVLIAAIIALITGDISKRNGE